MSSTLKQRKPAEKSSDEAATSQQSKTSPESKLPSKNKKIKQNKFWSFVESNSFLILLVVRSFSAIYNLIWDCDETYNYWEPLHFVLFNSGFQTWEYSPAYSLRSYLYIYLHALPLWPFRFLLHKITLFYMLRFVFAIVSSKLESDLFKSLCKRFGDDAKFAQVGKYFFLFTLTNTGMFLSSTSFLPSTFSMYLTMLAYSSWLTNPQSRQAIFAVGLAVLLGWPFAVLVGIPIALDICFISASKVFNGCLFFLKWTLVFGLLIAVPLIGFDSYMFGKLVIAPLNIVLYNVFPSNPEMGPDIYGREPLSYYLINCILNFNILAVIACLAPILLAYEYLTRKPVKKDASLGVEPFLIIFFAVLLWIVVFFTRPHKEERFLYPIYPLILILASLTLNYANYFSTKYLSKFKFKKIFSLTPYVVIALHAVLSAMRVLALLQNYSAATQIYHELNKPEIKHSKAILETQELINVCVSKEWYRFPSSFFIPENVDLNVRVQKWRLRFLPSDFKGQLPGYFNETVPIPLSTRYIDKNFNDLNKEVFQRYTDIKKCDFFIDTDNKVDDANVHLFMNKKDTKTKWKTLLRLPFLDSDNTPRLFRSFYIPFAYEKNAKFTYFKLRLRD